MDEVATYADAFGIDRGRLGYWRYIYADHGHGHPGRCPGEASWAGVRETRDRGADAGSGHAMNISTGVEPGLSAPTGAAGERVAAVRDEDEGHTDRGGPEARSETWPVVLMSRWQGCPHRLHLGLAGDAVAVPVKLAGVAGILALQGCFAGGADGGAVGVGHLDGVSGRRRVD